MGIRAVAGTVRWAWQPGGTDGGNRAAARELYRGSGVVALLAALLTATAVRSSGGRRLTLAVSASLAWLTTTWVTAFGTAVATIGRSTDDPPD